MFNYRTEKGRELVTCKAGVERLGAAFAVENGLLSSRFSDMAAVAGGGESKVGASIANAVDMSMRAYGNLSEMGSGADQLRQILFINAFKDSPASYGHVRAVHEQNTTWKFLGEMSQMTLAILHAVFQAIIYGSFPIVILLAFFSKRLRILGTYFEMMLWLEIWPLLFAILNLLVSVFARYSHNGTAISIDSIDHIVSIQGSYALAASSMGMFVPVLSYMIMKSGVSSFVHIAGQVLGATQHGAAAAAYETITGNRSLDHVSIGDRSFNNVHGNKTNIAGEYASGYMRRTLPDGRLQTDFLGMPSGEDRIYQGGAGITSSAGNFTVNTGQMLQDSVNRSIQHEESVVAGLSKDLSQSQQDRHSKATEFMDAYMNSHSHGQNYDIGSSLRSSDTSNIISRDAHAMSEDYGYQQRQSSAHTLEGGVGLNAGANITIGGSKGREGDGLLGKSWLSGNFTGGVNGDGGYKYTGTSTSEDSQSVKEDRSLSVNREDSDSDERAVNFAKNAHFTDSEMKEQRLAENLLHSNEEYQQKHEALTIHQNKLESMRQLRDQLSSVSVRGDENAYDKFLHYVAARLDPRFDYGQIGDKRALQIIEHGGPQRDQYLQDFANANMPQQMWHNNRVLEDDYKDTSHALEQEQMQRMGGHSVEVDLEDSKVRLDSNATALGVRVVDISGGERQYQAQEQLIDQKIRQRKSSFEESSDALKDKVDAKEEQKRHNLINYASPAYKEEEKQNPYFKKKAGNDE